MNQASSTSATTQITETDFMLREINKGLMIQWINADLFNRANNDIRSSVVFYDEEKVFLAAIPGPASDEDMARLGEGLYNVGIRFWSRGIV